MTTKLDECYYRLEGLKFVLAELYKKPFFNRDSELGALYYLAFIESDDEHERAYKERAASPNLTKS